MADRPTGSGLTWGGLPKTRQVQGRVVEKKILEDRGARVHPMSGAGSIKEDGSDEHCLYEVKLTRKSFSLKGSDLLKTLVRAVRQGKMGVWLIYFSDHDLTAEIRLVRGGRELGDTTSDTAR